MNCPKCKKDDVQVIDTRRQGHRVDRRRRCRSCAHVWATVERCVSEKARSRHRERIEILLRLHTAHEAIGGAMSRLGGSAKAERIKTVQKLSKLRAG